MNIRTGGFNRRLQTGFTIVELVVVIILLGVLSVYAVPRLVDNSGFSEFALQQRLQSALRTIQTKALQNSRGQYCYRMLFDTVNNAIGPSTAGYASVTATETCSNTIATQAPMSLLFTQAELQQLGIDITTQDGGVSFSRIDFDALGRPRSDVGRCLAGCTIQLIGEQTTQICIGAQGYIYAC